MRRFVGQSVVGDTILVVAAVAVALAVAAASQLGHSIVSEVLLLGAVAALLSLLAVRSLMRPKVLVSGIILIIWTLDFF